MKKIFLDGLEIWTWDVKKYLRLIRMSTVDKITILVLLGIVIWALHGWAAAETYIRLVLSK